MRTFLKVWVGIGLISIGFGVALLVIAFATGARWEDTADFTSMNESYSGVEKINMDIDFGKVNIVKGDGFSVTAENILENELESKVKDGVWNITEDSSGYGEIFGIRFPRKAIFWHWDDNFAPDITVTIPENFVAGDFTLKVGAGDVKADKIDALTGEFSVDAGKIIIHHLNIRDHSQYKIGAGEMTLKDVKVKNVLVDCGIGNLEADGDITGDSKVKCGIGNVDLNLDGKSDEYSYNIERGIGNIDINGESYRHIDHKQINNSNAENNLNLDCGIGNISVEFN